MTVTTTDKYSSRCGVKYITFFSCVQIGRFLNCRKYVSFLLRVTAHRQIHTRTLTKGGFDYPSSALQVKDFQLFSFLLFAKPNEKHKFEFHQICVVGRELVLISNAFSTAITMHIMQSIPMRNHFELEIFRRNAFFVMRFSSIDHNRRPKKSIFENITR